MSTEKLLEQLVGEGRLSDGFSVREQTASALSDAGVVDAIRSAGADQHAALADLAVVLGASLAVIRDELRASNQYLSTLSDSIANPLQTASRELQRRGLHALERGWYPEAAEAFSSALDKDPLAFEVHMGHGLAVSGMGDRERARRSFELAHRYASSDAPAAAAGALLLVAQSSTDSGDLEHARDTLTQAVAEFPTNAEARFRLAALDSDLDGLTAAVTLAPELALIALRVFPVDPSRTLAELSQSDGGPVGTATHVRAELDLFRSTFSPPVDINWRWPLDSELEQRFLGAGETLTYLRENATDLFKLSRYGLRSGQTAQLDDRLDALDTLVVLRERIPRTSAWTTPSRPPTPSSGGKGPFLIVARSNGLYIPGDAHASDEGAVVISVGTVARLEMGDIRGAARVLIGDYPVFTEDAAVHLLGEVMRRHLDD